VMSTHKTKRELLSDHRDEMEVALRNHTLDEVAKTIGCSKTTVSAWAQENNIASKWSRRHN
jgi:hypothetical protein